MRLLTNMFSHTYARGALDNDKIKDMGTYNRNAEAMANINHRSYNIPKRPCP
jgi:hypothetical protein